PLRASSARASTRRPAAWRWAPRRDIAFSIATRSPSAMRRVRQRKGKLERSATEHTSDSFDPSSSISLFLLIHFLCFAGEGGVSIVEMLYNTSLLCLVGAGLQASHSPRRLLLYNTARGRPICELNFLSTVLSVQLNYRRLVAVLESKLHVFDTASLKI